MAWSPVSRRRVEGGDNNNNNNNNNKNSNIKGVLLATFRRVAAQCVAESCRRAGELTQAALAVDDESSSSRVAPPKWGEMARPRQLAPAPPFEWPELPVHLSLEDALAREAPSLLREAFERGAALGFDAASHVWVDREEGLLRKLAEMAASRAQLEEEVHAMRRAMQAEAASLRAQHARSVDALRRERSERARTDASRERALAAATAAAIQNGDVATRVAVAAAEERAFSRHAKALKEAMRAQAHRHALALSEALATSEAANHALAAERRARDDAIDRSNKRREAAKSLDKAKKAVDDLCDQFVVDDRPTRPPPEQRRPRGRSATGRPHYPPPPQASRPLDDDDAMQRHRNTHPYLKRGAAAARFEARRCAQQQQHQHTQVPRVSATSSDDLTLS